MNKNKLLILINKEIDNEITDKEKITMQKEIQNNNESKKLYEDLSGTAALLKKEELNDYELNISDDVLKNLDHSKYSKKQKSSFSLLDLFTQKNLVMSYCLGIISGIALISVLYLTGVLYNPVTGMSGTMSSSENYSTFQKVDEIIINNEGIKANITSQIQSDMVIANIQLNSSQKYRIDINFNEKNVYVYSIKPVRMNNESNFTSGKNFVNINNKGENKFFILFKNNFSGEDIKIALLSETGHVSEYTLSTR